MSHDHETRQLIPQETSYRQLRQNLKHSATIKSLAFISICTFTYIIWSQYPSFGTRNDISLKDSTDVNKFQSKFEYSFQKNSSVSNDLKYILIWTGDDYYPFDAIEKGQQQFIRNNCSKTNCYLTSDKKFLGKDLTKYHAVAFNNRNMHSMHIINFPLVRSPDQVYIFFETESAGNYPVCRSSLDDIFNWTATYKLDSDILFKYIMIRDKYGRIIGPKPNMTWIEDMDEVDDDIVQKIKKKSKAVAWFVSHCETKSKREQYGKKLQKALEIFGLNVDIYGACGPFKCARWNSNCEVLLQRDYYFYLSFENSFAEDYVTEKLLTALQNYAVPVVFGGADYTRFLPPGSYLDARKLSPADLAALINHLMKRPGLYRKFFRWRKYYTYEEAEKQNVCNLCEALNNKTKLETTSTYHDFRKWWNVGDDQC